MSDTPTILVTGGSGFVGRHLLPSLREKGLIPRNIGRSEIGAINRDVDWTPFLDGVTTVIHLAGRAHVMHESTANPIDLYREVNLHGTIRLAEQARAAGVKRFIFISSVKVMGEESHTPFTADMEPAPCDPYGVSKIEAEEALLALGGPMQIVILRPPLVYGPGVKGNFIALLRLLDRGLPLPLGRIRNQRSMIFVKNLVSAILHALSCPPGIYLPSDQHDLSTPQLFRMTAQALGKPACLLPFPVNLLKLAGFILGKSTTIQRLTGSLQVEGTLPGWKPPIPVERGLVETADWFRTNRGCE